ncbi:hypothetical protein [Streptomyces luteireticuli]|uniref:hypothetical protein n=1 Tax=Streptomyces luteireticuli TaxID=173858 RepID=UPI003558672A
MARYRRGVGGLLSDLTDDFGDMVSDVFGARDDWRDDYRGPCWRHGRGYEGYGGWCGGRWDRCCCGPRWGYEAGPDPCREELAVMRAELRLLARMMGERGVPSPDLPAERRHAVDPGHDR